MTKKFLKLFFAISAFVLTATNKTFAAGLVPCGPGTDKIKCEFCDIFSLIQNVINFIFEVSVALAVVFIIYGGFLVLTAADSPERLGQGKKTIISAIIGLAIALGAWMIIDIVMKVLVGGSPSEFGPWNQMPC